MNYFKAVFILQIIYNLNNKIDCLPVNNEIPLAISALQNPDLFGGDMLGIDKTKFANRNALPNDLKLWPMGSIPFVLDSSLAQQRDLIVRGMNHYHQNTCIRFVERNNEYDYIHITKEEGCYSYVGRTGGKQLLSLGEGCWSMGTVVHELGHAVGFYHEHQRSDREDYIDILEQNVKPGLMDQFNKLAPDQNRLLYEFDFHSIMLYGPNTFSKDGKSITMSPKPKYSSEKMIEVFEKYGLSKTNILSIQKLYQCE